MRDERLLPLSDPVMLLRELGVFRNADAATLGIPHGRGGRLPGQRLRPGVRYLLDGRPSREASWAADVLYAGPGAVLAGVAAGARAGWLDPAWVRQTDVLVPWRTDRADQPGLRLHRTRLVDGRRVRSLGVASPARTLLSIAALEDRDTLCGAMASAVQKRNVRLYEVRAIASAHRRVPGAYAAALAALELDGGIQSMGELSTVRLLRAQGFPEPEPQVEIRAEGRLLTVSDFWWDDGVAGYYDGADVHLSLAAQRADDARRTRLRASGIAPVRITSVLLADPRLFRAEFEEAFRIASATRWHRVGRVVTLSPLAF